MATPNLGLAEKILALRLKNKSYKQIAAELGIAKSTVGYWMAENETSKAIKEKLFATNQESRARIEKMAATNRKRWADYREQATAEAVKEFPAICQNPIFIAGIMLYWGEGDSKPRNALRFANTDPRMVGLYMKFLREVMNFPDKKIKIGLILYLDLSDAECIHFWSGITNLPADNFYKTQYIQGHHPTHRLAHGVCMVTVNGRTYQKVKVLTWIDLFQKTHIMNP